MSDFFFSSNYAIRGRSTRASLYLPVFRALEISLNLINLQHIIKFRNEATAVEDIDICSVLNIRICERKNRG